MKPLEAKQAWVAYVKAARKFWKKSQDTNNDSHRNKETPTSEQHRLQKRNRKRKNRLKRNQPTPKRRKRHHPD